MGNNSEQLGFKVYKILQADSFIASFENSHYITFNVECPLFHPKRF